MFWSEHPDFLKEIHDLRPNWIIMPEAFNPKNVEKIVALLHPQLLGADERDFNAATIAAAKAVNVGFFCRSTDGAGVAGRGGPRRCRHTD